MNNNTDNYPHDLEKKIMKGLELSFQKLLAKKIKNDESFVFSENGEIVVVRARDMKERLKIED